MTKTIFSPLVNFYSQRVQIIFLSIFLIINVALFLGAVPTIHDLHDVKPLHPTYAGASDGQRYWGVAKTLVNHGTFEYETVPGSLHPLRRGGPITPLILSGLIKAVGFEDAPAYIVSFQCALLYIVGIFATSLAKPFRVDGRLVQGLTIFNPNLIGVAHHAQSEIIFLFFFICALILIRNAMYYTAYALKSASLLGILSALCLLTRPASFPFFLFAIAFLVTFYCFECYRWRVGLFFQRIQRLGISALVAVLVMSPWLIRNYNVFDTPLPVGSATVLNGNLLKLEHAVYAAEDNELQHRVNQKVTRAAILSDLNPCCLKGLHRWSYSTLDPEQLMCPDPLDQVHCPIGPRPELYFYLLSQYQLTDIASALTYALVSTYLGAGVRNLTQYLSSHPIETSMLHSEFDGFTSYLKLLSVAAEQHHTYFLLLTLGLSFAGLCRLTLLLGIPLSFKTGNSQRQALFFLLTLVVFTLSFMFEATSRFRVPLEPLLALYSGIGFSRLHQLVYRKRSIHQR